VLTTRQKIQFAKFLSRTLIAARRAVGLGPVVTVVRSGVRWRLDLREGIDLAIYLGIYRTIPKAALEAVKEGDLVVDVGANIGPCTLPLARRVGETGKVIAVEPTKHAFDKLSGNLALNPHLAERVEPLQCFLCEAPGDTVPEAIPSSWPLSGGDGEEVDPLHGGKAMDTRGAWATSIDAVLRDRADGRRLSLIKVDVDGHELSVLRGAEHAIRQHRPVIVIEIAPYVQARQPGGLKALLDEISRLHYRLEDANTGHIVALDEAAIRRQIPDGAGTDMIARFNPAHAGVEE
jgi:FkbM family methyltransferase